MEMFIPLQKETIPPRVSVLNTIKTVGYHCYNPKQITLKPFTVNFIDMNCQINFSNPHQILKLESIPNQKPFKILNPFIFPTPDQEKTLLPIPIVTDWIIRLPKNTLLCFMHFVSVADALIFLEHGKYQFIIL